MTILQRTTVNNPKYLSCRYSWDFDYDGKSFKAEVLLDKKGDQAWKFKPGEHTIGVKVVDNDGLENIEVIDLKVNGKVERKEKTD